MVSRGRGGQGGCCLSVHRGEARLTGRGLSPQHSSVFTVTAREFLINHDTCRHDRQRHHDSTWLHSSGLRIWAWANTTRLVWPPVSLSHIPSRSGTSENSRRWPGKLPQQSPHSMLPSLRENRLHRCHQTRLSESEANFSIIRNTFDRQLRGGGDEPGDSGWHIYSTDTTHKVNEWGPSVQHREVYSVLCGEVNGQEI